jgi:hypothetical protein
MSKPSLNDDLTLHTKGAPERIWVAFDPLPKLAPATREAIAVEALRVNMRYLEEFIEEYAFCPFSRQGRQQGQVHRYVHWYDDRDLTPLIELMHRVAADPQQVVVQVIMPLIDVEPRLWVRFCHELTAYAHARLPGPPVLAVAPLHPRLAFNPATPARLVPLFRRTPDPTIQWVRLDGLEAIYEGRGSGTAFVDIDAIAAFIAAAPKRPPLWDRIAETNAAMAKRLTVDRVVALLEGFERDARDSYAGILLAADDA